MRRGGALNGFESVAMKRLSRHTVVVLFVLLLSSLGGMSVAVVAFGQSGGDPDATVPLGDYTGTTPAPGSTTPLSSYTSTTPTTQTQPVTTPTETGASTPKSSSGNKPSRTHGSTTVANGSGPLPSRATRSGPTHLAFTGGEPLVVGAFGLALIVAGFVLHRRRRAARGSL
jgi:hypothetical protein